MNQIICNLLDWYQTRIGSYDKQSWEKSLDARFLKNNIYCLSQKSNRVEDLIDIDLIKGSTFTKTKSKLSICSVMLNGIKRMLFYPFYFRWWQYQTNRLTAVILLVIYLLQISNIFIYNSNSLVLVHKKKQLISLIQLATPNLIMLILSLMYTYITSALPNNNDVENEVLINDIESYYNQIDSSLLSSVSLSQADDYQLFENKEYEQTSSKVNSRRQSYDSNAAKQLQIPTNNNENLYTLNGIEPQREKNNSLKTKLINKCQSEIFDLKNKSLKQEEESRNKIENDRLAETKSNETNGLRRRVNLNHSSPKLNLKETRTKSKSNTKLVDSVENIRDNFDLNERMTKSHSNEPKLSDKCSYYSKNFFIPTDSTGSTDDDDNNNNELDLMDNNEEIYNAKASKKLIRKANVFLQEDEDDYDLNDEGDLSDSDQTESCILNDANNNDLLEYADNLDKIKDNKYDEVVVNSQTNMERINDENNNEKIKSLRSNSIGITSVKERISCIIWHKNEWKGVDLSMLEISNCIIMNVKKASLPVDYFYVGIIFSILIGLTPIYYHNNEFVSNYLSKNTSVHSNETTNSFLSELFYNCLPFENFYLSVAETINIWINVQPESGYMIVNTLVSTLILCMLFFSMLTIAERTLNQRFLHAKYFCYLTSNRRARKHNLPHFRLGKVENIKTWLSVRSYMKRRGPQRSIDAIISSTFLIGVFLCSIVCIRFLQDADFLTDSLFNWQLVIWCLCIWTYMLRFMTIGFKINKKYRNCMSMVITEQINLYLQMEKTPGKKDQLTVVNNVLKLAADLLKEIENPFKISGLGVDPWVYNITKVVILSAFSAVLSELFGFKLKLYKIKIS